MNRTSKVFAGAKNDWADWAAATLTFKVVLDLHVKHDGFGLEGFPNNPYVWYIYLTST